MTIWFWISWSVSEIFAAELRSRPKSGQILHVFALEIFLGCAPKISDRHYKIRPSTDHRAKFQAGRPTHLGDLVLGKKFKKNICSKKEVLPKTIVFGRTKEWLFTRHWLNLSLPLAYNLKVYSPDFVMAYNNLNTKTTVIIISVALLFFVGLHNYRKSRRFQIDRSMFIN